MNQLQKDKLYEKRRNYGCFWFIYTILSNPTFGCQKLNLTIWSDLGTIPIPGVEGLKMEQIW